MSTKKINLNNPAIKSRVKKYDTYQQRGNFNHRNNSTLKPDVHFAPIAVPQIIQSHTLTSSKPNQIVSNAQRKSTVVIKNVQKKHFQNSFSNPRKHSTNSVAMQAVAESKIYDNELYPDNEITLYGKSKRKLSLIQKSLYGFGVLVLVFSAFVSVQTFVNNKHAKELVATLGENSTKDDQGVSEGTGDEPSEEKISESAILSFQTSNPQDPRYIRIPEIGVLARIKNLGKTPNGAVDAPKNIYDAGWYNGSARPGSLEGSSLIVAHVSGWTNPGIFKNINKLVEGSKFEIEKGNGEKNQYSVTKKEQIPVDQVDMSSVLSAENTGQNDIKLMTCSGKYNKNTKTFDDRYIVYAKPVI